MPQEATPFELLGGEKVLFALVERFYALMDSEPEFHAVRRLHSKDLSGSRNKQGDMPGQQ
jgi:hemoglobin